VVRFTANVKSSQSVPRLLVDQALAKRGTTLPDFIEGGRKQGNTIEEIHADLVAATGVDFSARTLFRWARDIEKVSA
jgi:hypothetical protein